MIRLLLISQAWLHFILEIVFIYARDLPRRAKVAFYSGKIAYHSILCLFSKGIAGASLSVDLSLDDRFNEMKKVSDIVGFYTRQAAIVSGILILSKAAISFGIWGVLILPFLLSLIGIFLIFSLRMIAYCMFAFWEEYFGDEFFSKSQFSKSWQHKFTLYLFTAVIIFAPAVAVTVAAFLLDLLKL